LFCFDRMARTPFPPAWWMCRLDVLQLSVEQFQASIGNCMARDTTGFQFCANPLLLTCRRACQIHESSASPLDFPLLPPSSYRYHTPPPFCVPCAGMSKRNGPGARGLGCISNPISTRKTS
jgi:hypothetical protein